MFILTIISIVKTIVLIVLLINTTTSLTIKMFSEVQRINLTVSLIVLIQLTVDWSN